MRYKKRNQKNLDIKSIKEIEKLNSKENVLEIILFITLVLFLEKDKEKRRK